jgi:two-component system, OmpR family, response regulator RegX3
MMLPGIVVGIVEDDVVQAELYSAMLAAAGMRAQSFTTVQEFRRRYGTESIDVLLLDWNLPGVTGIDLLRSLRNQHNHHLPIIVLTANGDERDVVYGLQCGADDYIVKPPRPAELIARIRAAYRRSQPNVVAGQADTHPFEFDYRARELRLHGELVRVTEREFDLLAYFFQRADRIVSRQMLLTDIWNLGPDSTTRSVDTYVSRVRKSLGLNGDSGWKLEGVYQHGYRLVRASSLRRDPLAAKTVEADD